MEREEILKEIRNIVGGKTFTFSEDYLNKAGHACHCVGQERPYSSITKKYLFVSCFAVYKYDEGAEEYGTSIQKFPIVYNRMTGSFVKKVALDDMFTKDLQKVLDDVKYYLWWEAEVRLPKLQIQLDEAKKYANMFYKMKERIENDSKE